MTEELRIGSLCSGYGGLDMGVQAAVGGSVAWHVEFDKAPSRILDHHWPGVPNHGDVKKTDWHNVEPVDVLTAGYPCQPFSHAGRRRGTDDPRHLWPDVARAISVLRPRLVVLENVRGHVSLGLDAVIGDLSSLGYDARWSIVRASDVGAPHIRARIFITAVPTDTHGVGDGWTRDLGRRWAEFGDHRLATVGGGPASADHAAHAGSERHGRGEDVGMVGRVAGEVSAGRERCEQLPGDCGAARVWDAPGPDAADPNSVGLGGWGTVVEPQGSRVRVASAGHQPSVVADPEVERPGLPVGGFGEEPRGDDGRADGPVLGVDLWGPFGPAIRRWERTLGRPVPAPTRPAGRDHKPRLSPVFVEWMMGLNEGHVTGHDIGLTRSQQLHALGNGVVPQQAAHAVRLLLGPAR